MLKSILHKSTRNFEKQYGYDASYMHHMIDVSTGAGLRLGLLPILSFIADQRRRLAFGRARRWRLLWMRIADHARNLLLIKQLNLARTQKSLKIVRKAVREPIMIAAWDFCLLKMRLLAGPIHLSCEKKSSPDMAKKPPWPPALLLLAGGYIPC